MYDGFQPGQDLDPLPDYLASRESPETNPALAAEARPLFEAYIQLRYGELAATGVNAEHRARLKTALRQFRAGVKRFKGSTPL